MREGRPILAPKKKATAAAPPPDLQEPSDQTTSPPPDTQGPETTASLPPGAEGDQETSTQNLPAVTTQNLPEILEALNRHIGEVHLQYATCKAALRDAKDLNLSQEYIETLFVHALDCFIEFIYAKADEGDALKSVPKAGNTLNAHGGRLPILPEGMTAKESSNLQKLANNRIIIEAVIQDARDKHVLPTEGAILRRIELIKRPEPDEEKARKSLLKMFGAAVSRIKAERENLKDDKRARFEHEVQTTVSGLVPEPPPPQYEPKTGGHVPIDDEQKLQEHAKSVLRQLADDLEEARATALSLDFDANDRFLDRLEDTFSVLRGMGIEVKRITAPDKGPDGSGEGSAHSDKEEPTEAEKDKVPSSDEPPAKSCEQDGDSYYEDDEDGEPWPRPKDHSMATFENDDGKTVTKLVHRSVRKLTIDGVVYKRQKREKPRSRTQRTADYASYLRDRAERLRTLLEEHEEVGADGRDFDAEATAIMADFDCETLRGLQDEMENWAENMPENLQSTDKHEAVREAADTLSEVVDILEELVVDGIDDAEQAADTLEQQAEALECVEFPPMFGNIY